MRCFCLVLALSFSSFASVLDVTTAVSAQTCTDSAATNVACEAGDPRTGPYVWATMSFGPSSPSQQFPQSYTPGAYSYEGILAIYNPSNAYPGGAQFSFGATLDLPSNWGNLVVTGFDSFSDTLTGVTAIPPLCKSSGDNGPIQGCMIAHVPGSPLIIPTYLFSTQTLGESAGFGFDFEFLPEQTVPEPHGIALIGLALLAGIVARTARVHNHRRDLSNQEFLPGAVPRARRWAG
jgi:hypothetical protein